MHIELKSGQWRAIRTLGRWTALTGYLGLYLMILAFVAWIDPPSVLPRSLVLLALLVPLLFPLRGMLHARRYTHAWSSLLSLGYILIAITVAAAPDGRAFGLAMLLTSTLWFIGTLAFVRADRSLRDAA